MPVAQCLTTEQRLQIKEKPTDVYVWGNGFQVDHSLDFTNFFPRRLNPFTGETQVAIARFGHYHEAYLDKTGSVHVCTKNRQGSRETKGKDDREREITHVLRLAKPVRDISFTKNRLFALTESGEVYMWRIKEVVPQAKSMTSLFSEEEDRPTGELIDEAI